MLQGKMDLRAEKFPLLRQLHRGLQLVKSVQRIDRLTETLLLEPRECKPVQRLWTIQAVRIFLDDFRVALFRLRITFPAHERFRDPEPKTVGPFLRWPFHKSVLQCLHRHLPLSLIQLRLRQIEQHAVRAIRIGEFLHIVAELPFSEIVKAVMKRSLGNAVEFILIRRRRHQQQRQ